MSTNIIPMPVDEDQDWFELTFRAPFGIFMTPRTPLVDAAAFEMPAFAEHLANRFGYKPESGTMADFITSRFGEAELARLLGLVEHTFQRAA